MKFYKTAISFMSKHPTYNALIHASGGIALGIFVSTYLNLSNPLIWILIFGAISLAGHLYVILSTKK